jgi:hypothetical protein
VTDDIQDPNDDRLADDVDEADIRGPLDDEEKE